MTTAHTHTPFLGQCPPRPHPNAMLVRVMLSEALQEPPNIDWYMWGRFMMEATTSAFIDPPFSISDNYSVYKLLLVYQIFFLDWRYTHLKQWNNLRSSHWKTKQSKIKANTYRRFLCWCACKHYNFSLWPFFLCFTTTILDNKLLCFIFYNNHFKQ